MYRLLLLCLSFILPLAASEKPLILVTIAPYGYLIERIAEETVEVATVIPSGVNMHIYEPTIRELTSAQRASIWFQVGETFEERAGKTLQEKNPHLKLLALWKMVPLLEGGCSHCKHHDTRDRHIWTSPRLILVQCHEMAKVLTLLQPQHEQLYRKNLEALEKELIELDGYIHEQLKPLQGSALLVSHPAFGYFCKDYEITQLSVESSGRDPLPKDVEDILKKAQHYKVRAVFTQKGYNNKGAELIAEKLKLPVFCVDPYARDYLENMRQMVELIEPSR